MNPEEIKIYIDQKVAEGIAEALRQHEHSGYDSPQVLIENILATNNVMFKTVSAAPSTAPINIFEQIQIYVNGATLRLYWYDKTAAAWHYVTATA